MHITFLLAYDYVPSEQGVNEITSVFERLQSCDYSLTSAFSLVMRVNGRCPNRKLASVRLSHLAWQDNLAYPSFEHLQMLDETCTQVLALLPVSEQVHARVRNQFAQRCVSHDAFIPLLC